MRQPPKLTMYVSSIDDAELDRWAAGRLGRAARAIETDTSLVRQLSDPFWLIGEDDWLPRGELLERLAIHCGQVKWPAFAYALRLKYGLNECLHSALRNWDDWISSGAADADALGFDELAPCLYAHRAGARALVDEVDGWRGAERALVADRWSALHDVRAEISRDLDCWRRAPPELSIQALHQLIEPLAKFGKTVFEAVVHASERKELHCALRQCTVDAEMGLAEFIHDALVLLDHLAGSDVAELLLDSMQERATLSGALEVNPAMHTHFCALALSALAPAKAGDAIVKPACEKYLEKTRRKRRRGDDSLRLAIAWWRCRRAQGVNISTN